MKKKGKEKSKKDKLCLIENDFLKKKIRIQYLANNLIPRINY